MTHLGDITKIEKLLQNYTTKKRRPTMIDYISAVPEDRKK